MSVVMPFTCQSFRICSCQFCACLKKGRLLDSPGQRGCGLLSQRTEKIIRTIVPRRARNWLRSPSKSIEWLWDSLCFSVGATRELALLPGWHLVCRLLLEKKKTKLNMLVELY